MIKSVTRTLYIDGKPIAEYTQDPMADSELADMEQIAARMELLERPKKTQDSADVGNNAGDLGCLVRKGRPKALQFKLKLLQAVSKMLLLGNEPAVKLLSPSILVHLKLSLPKNPFFNRLKRDSN